MEVTAIRQGCRIVAFNGARPYRLLLEPAQFVKSPDWFWHFRHRAEAERGLDANEDLLCPGQFMLRLAPGECATLIATAEVAEPESAPAVLQRRKDRARQLLRSLPAETPEWVGRLTLAADQFIVGRATAADEDTTQLAATTVLAGYPWFGDWGRDTMIALPGLTSATGRTAEAASILRTFAQHVSQGMLPNRFPDNGESPEYNTVDATLWYFHAIAAYIDTTGDSRLLSDIYPVLRDIISWHFKGTRYSIAVDSADGLLYAGAPGVQLTWMDAKIGTRVITPRIGKPVEINAIWHYSLACMAHWATTVEDSRHVALSYELAASRVAAAFAETFWSQSDGYLYDVVDGPDDPTDETGRHVDSSLRPNQIFAVSLGSKLLSAAQAKAVVDICAAELLTPVGLRSLATGDVRFAGRYTGGPEARDAVYHQGTVWNWLLGPFVIAHYRVYGDPTYARAMLRSIAAEFSR